MIYLQSDNLILELLEDHLRELDIQQHLVVEC